MNTIEIEDEKNFFHLIDVDVENLDTSIFPVIKNNTSLDINGVVNILKTIYDPEINYSIYDLGLIYGIYMDETTKNIHIIMTLTSANCPEAQSLPENVKEALKNEYPDYNITLNITFEPSWTVDNMTEEVKLGLGLL